MRITVARDQLVEALKLAIEPTKGQTINPIFTNVLLTVDKDGLEIRGTNHDYEVVQRVTEFDKKKNGACLVKGKLFYDIVSDLRADTVRLELDGATLNVESGFDLYELASADPADFPPPQAFDKGGSFTVQASDLAEALRCTPQATSQEKGRYALNGVFVEPARGGIKFVGTSGHVLCFIHIAGAETVETNAEQLILPRTLCQLIRRLCANLEAEAQVTCRSTPDRFGIEVNGQQTSGRMVHGRFPDYSAVIPKDLDKSFKCDRAALAHACRRAKHLTSPSTAAVRFELGGERLQLKSKSPGAGQANVELEVDYDGPELAIGLDPVYVEQALDHFDAADTITVDLKDKDTGIIVHAGDRDRKYYLCMPIDI